jgi:hypothetical protein
MKAVVPLVAFVAAGAVAVHASAGMIGSTAACTATATRATVHRFVADIDRGEASAAAQLFAPEPLFQWYSTRAPGRRLGAQAYDRGTLASYFKTRVRAHEHLRLTKLDARYDAGRHIVNFSGTLVRTADGLRSTSPHWFKGAAACMQFGPSLIVWSM